MGGGRPPVRPQGVHSPAARGARRRRRFAPRRWPERIRATAFFSVRTSTPLPETRITDQPARRSITLRHTDIRSKATAKAAFSRYTARDRHTYCTDTVGAISADRVDDALPPGSRAALARSDVTRTNAPLHYVPIRTGFRYNFPSYGLHPNIFDEVTKINE